MGYNGFPIRGAIWLLRLLCSTLGLGTRYLYTNRWTPFCKGNWPCSDRWSMSTNRMIPAILHHKALLITQIRGEGGIELGWGSYCSDSVDTGWSSYSFPVKIAPHQIAEKTQGDVKVIYVMSLSTTPLILPSYGHNKGYGTTDNSIQLSFTWSLHWSWHVFGM